MTITLLLALMGAVSLGVLAYLASLAIAALSRDFSSLDMRGQSVFYLMLPLARRMNRYSRRIHHLPMVTRYLQWIHPRLAWSGLDLVGFRPETYVASHLVLLAVGVAIPWITIGELDPAVIAVFSWFVGLSLFTVPFFVVTSHVRRRSDEVFRSLPYFMDILSILVKSGMDFTEAIEKLSVEELLDSRVLRTELKLFSDQLKMNRDRDSALHALGNRINLMEMRSFTTALQQQARIGAPLEDTLDNLSRIMRFRRLARAEERAHQAPVKILFPMMLCFFPAIFLVLLGPMLIRAFSQAAMF